MHADLTQPSGDQCSRTKTPPLACELTDVKIEDVRAGFDCACGPELRLQVGDGFDPQLLMTLGMHPPVALRGVRRGSMECLLGRSARLHFGTWWRSWSRA